MTLEDRVQVQRLHLFRRAGELGSVTAACQVAGISRSLFYRLRRICGAGEARAQGTEPSDGCGNPSRSAKSGHLPAESDAQGVPE